MILRSERSIIDKWESSDIVVSVCCMTYNHEEYIEQAIVGFLSQETNFAFEIIIHDDASQDSTPEIIKRYQGSYPHIIFPIFQTENQHSKKEKSIGTFRQFVYPKMRGKYIALCEGDDYWIHPYKLQQQYEALERNPSLDLCFHPAKVISNDEFIRMQSDYWNDEKIIAVETVIKGGGGYMPTASIMYRRVLRDDIDNFFDVYGPSPVGDVILQFLGSLRGGALYLPIIGCVYRTMATGSWSSRMATDFEFRLVTIKNLVRMYNNLNQYSDLKFGPLFSEIISSFIISESTNPYMEKKYRSEIYHEQKQYLTRINQLRIPFRTMIRSLKKGIKVMIKKLSCND